MDPVIGGVKVVFVRVIQTTDTVDSFHALLVLLTITERYFLQHSCAEMKATTHYFPTSKRYLCLLYVSIIMTIPHNSVTVK